MFPVKASAEDMSCRTVLGSEVTVLTQGQISHLASTGPIPNLWKNPLPHSPSCAIVVASRCVHTAHTLTDLIDCMGRSRNALWDRPFRLLRCPRHEVEKCSTFQAAADRLANQIALCKCMQIHYYILTLLGLCPMK